MQDMVSNWMLLLRAGRADFVGLEEFGVEKVERLNGASFKLLCPID